MSCIMSADPPRAAAATCHPRAAPCGKYMQPPVTKSLKPDSKYQPFAVPFEESTTYRLSYNWCGEGYHPQRIKSPCSNENPICCKMGDITTQRHDYRFWGPCKPRQPITPCNWDSTGMGPMSRMTTVRHDYGPKPIFRLDPIKPPTQRGCSVKPLEFTTVMAASYQPPPKVEPTPSFRPERAQQQYCEPFPDETIQKLSYVPLPLKKTEHVPCACKGQYVKQCLSTERTSTYKLSYTVPLCFVGGAPAAAAPGPNRGPCKAACFGSCCGCAPTH